MMEFRRNNNNNNNSMKLLVKTAHKGPACVCVCGLHIKSRSCDLMSPATKRCHIVISTATTIIVLYYYHYLNTL